MSNLRSDVHTNSWAKKMTNMRAHSTSKRMHWNCLIRAYLLQRL